MITGDGRQDGANSTRPEDKNGVNSMVIPEIAQAVVREKAQFLVFTGDLVLGASRSSLVVETMKCTVLTP